MAKDKIAKVFLAITKDKFTIDTIAEMIATKHLAEWDIVRLNGYYSAGDGANHIRKISKTDDGSGILLANGLYANIVHEGEVNVSWFGAKGDGVSDDSEYVRKAQLYCEQYGRIGIFIDKHIYMASTVTVKKGLRLRGSGNSAITSVDDIPSAIHLVGNVIAFDIVGEQWFLPTHPRTMTEYFDISDLVIVGKSVNEKNGTAFRLRTTGGPSRQHRFVNNGSFFVDKLFHVVVDKAIEPSGTSVWCLDIGETCMIHFVNHAIYTEVLGEVSTDEISTVGGMSIENSMIEGDSKIKINGLCQSRIVNNLLEGVDSNFDISVIGVVEISNNYFELNTGTSKLRGVNSTAHRDTATVVMRNNLFGTSKQLFELDNLNLRIENNFFSPVWYAGDTDVSEFQTCIEEMISLKNGGIARIDGDFNYNKTKKANVGSGVLINQQPSEKLTTLPAEYKKTSIPIKIGDTENEAVRIYQDETEGFIIPSKNYARVKYTNTTPNDIIYLKVLKSSGRIVIVSFGNYETKSINVKEGDFITIQCNGNGVEFGILNVENTDCRISIPIATQFGNDFKTEKVIIPTVLDLDTPYHASNMQKLGILDKYHNYLKELHEYEKSQNFQSDSEIMNLNVLQPPVIPTGVEAYAKEYNSI